MKPLYYLASPYSHEDLNVMQKRYEKAMEAKAYLMKERNLFVYSPIVENHPISQLYDLPKNIDFWKGYDTTILLRCDGLIVLCIPGWDTSEGVAYETAMWKATKPEIITSEYSQSSILYLGKINKSFSLVSSPPSREDL